ncbi:NAD/FAD-binding protein [Thiocapsa imhoffii]|uniref:NAD/FAD-binding protein n=1 Tax=Thiocapsa imhoffii TaxID=382777 RepID=A0A9X1B9K5_9GAMM|nr:FAD-dependent oxidoreductase [Thiocapsa imhoffii]MBK1645962.1 NAD/FAD-binding protein [Thiocapsa imhoffii]
MSVKSVGVVGGGIGGLAAAWLLDEQYEVTLLERNAYVGGHSHTIEVEDPRGAFPVDTGFMVFNRRNYPLLTSLFEYLGVPTYPTSMSFSASVEGGRIEYGGDNLNTLFGARANLFDLGFLRMVTEILRFNAAAKSFLRSSADRELTVGEFLTRGRYSERFARHYLLPMAAAIWSCPTEQMRAFPFLSFARFFANHGLLDLVDRPDWETVRGGSQAYVQAMLARFRGRCLTHTAVDRIVRSNDQGGVEVHTTAGERLVFDAVVMGCHADEALAILDTPSTLEREILGCFSYQTNQVFLHTDRTLMPQRRRVWSSWNYLEQSDAGSQASTVTVTYWMNSLQDLPRDPDVFVSLNPRRPPRRETILAELTYEHPMFDRAAGEAQQRIGEIQGRDRLWFSGAYLGYGFHEDGLRAAVSVAEGFGVRPPWQDLSMQPAAPSQQTTSSGRIDDVASVGSP